MHKKIWPVHLKPLPGEALSSWLSRLSKEHALPLNLFRKELFATPSETDIDQIVAPEFFTQLAQQTGTDVAALWQMTYSADEGSVYARRSDNNLEWIAPMTAIHSGQRRHVFPYCPGCFTEDPVPYYRKAWRHAFLPICPKHGLLSLDCAHCGQPYTYIGPTDDPPLIFAQTLDTCKCCGRRMNKGSAPDLPKEIRRAALLVQEKILNGLSERFILVSGYGYVHICMYLLGIHMLNSLLRRPIDGPKIWRWIASSSGLANRHHVPFQNERRRLGPDMSVESIVPWEKAWLLVMSDWLTEDWPRRLVAMFKDTGAVYDTKSYQSGYVPFWMFVDLPNSKPPKIYRKPDEIAAARAVLMQRRKWVTPQKHLITFMRTGNVAPISYLRATGGLRKLIERPIQERFIAPDPGPQNLGGYLYQPVEIDLDHMGLRESLRDGGGNFERFNELAEILKAADKSVD